MKLTRRQGKGETPDEKPTPVRNIHTIRLPRMPRRNKIMALARISRGMALFLLSLWVIWNTGCEPRGQRICHSQEDCTSRQQCVRGVCQDISSPSCKQDSDCPALQTCQQGQCQGTGASGVCQPNAATCEGNTLRQCKPDGSGYTTTDCGGFHECKENQCVRKSTPSLCGNGKIDGDEQCDDGNTRSGDGCSQYCLTERVMLFEPPAISRDLAPFILSSRVCRSATKRDSYKNDTSTFYVVVKPIVCKIDDRPVVSAQNVQDHIKFLNQVYQDTRLVFVMDEIQWETNKDDCEVFYDTESTATLLRYSQATKIAVFYARNIYGGTFSIGGYANLSGVVVNANSFGIADILAHELGHSFGLDHPHACYHGKETANNCAQAGDELCDTPPDPGPKGVNGLDYCSDNTRKDGQCTVTRCQTVSCPGGEKPMILNLMSYYHCGTSLTPEQISTIRCVAFNDQAKRVSRKRPCQKASDCPTPETCQNSFCEAPPGCQNHTDCQARYYCNNRQCVSLSTGACRKDADCAGGQVCRNDTCQRPPECYTNNDCPGGQVCQNGSCKPAPLPECQQHSDCPARKYCDNGSCKDLAPGSCRANSDCSSQQICQNQVCVTKPPPSCTKDSDCSAQQVCRNRLCVSCTPDGQQANSNEACCSGERNERSQCCTERSCCGPQNHSYFNANGQCSCDTGYEWVDSNAPKDFRCRLKQQGPTCKQDKEQAATDAECCSQERNDVQRCCTGHACCGPRHFSQTLSNGNCQCLAGYTWVNPSDNQDFRCQTHAPACQKDGVAVTDAKDCCSQTRDLLGLCCSGKSCCSSANFAQVNGQGACECLPGYTRVNPNDPQDWQCQKNQGCPQCCSLVKTLTGHTNLVRSVAIHPNGTVLASASYDQTVKLWDVSTGKLLQTLTGPTNAVMSVHFHPTGNELVAGCYDKTYRRWTSSGQFVGSSQLFAPVRSVVYRPDGQELATGTENGAYVWGWPSGGGNGFASSTYIRSMTYSPNSQTLVVTTKDKTVLMYQASNRQLIRTLTGHVGEVFDAVFHVQGNLLASSSASIKLWDSSTGQLLQTLQGHNRGIYSVAFHPQNGVLFSAGEDAKINLWDTKTGQVIQVLQDHTGPVYTLAFRRDGKLLASGSKDNTIKLWSCP